MPLFTVKAVSAACGRVFIVHSESQQSAVGATTNNIMIEMLVYQENGLICNVKENGIKRDNNNPGQACHKQTIYAG